MCICQLSARDKNCGCVHVAVVLHLWSSCLSFLYTPIQRQQERESQYTTLPERDRERKGEAAENLPGLIVQKTELTQEKKDGKGREAPNLWLFHHKTQCKVMRKLKINAFSYPPPNLGTLVVCEWEQYKEPAENKKTRSWQTFPVLREAHFSLLSSSPLVVETERGESVCVRERERRKDPSHLHLPAKLISPSSASGSPPVRPWPSDQGLYLCPCG